MPFWFFVFLLKITYYGGAVEIFEKVFELIKFHLIFHY